MTDIIREGIFIRLNKAEWYERADFMSWLNHPDTNEFTWHIKGKEATDYSDIVLYYERAGDTLDTNLPQDILNELDKVTKPYEECLIWIQNA